MQLEAKAGMGVVEPNSVGLAGSAPRFLPLLSFQKAAPSLWIPWDLSKDRGSWVGALSIPPIEPTPQGPDDLCPPWTEHRSFCPFSVGPHLFSCLVVQAGWGPVAPLLPPPCL